MSRGVFIEAAYQQVDGMFSPSQKYTFWQLRRQKGRS